VPPKKKKNTHTHSFSWHQYPLQESTLSFLNQRREVTKAYLWLPVTVWYLPMMAGKEIRRKPWVIFPLSRKLWAMLYLTRSPITHTYLGCWLGSMASNAFPLGPEASIELTLYYSWGVQKWFEEPGRRCRVWL
jgi:hypothetical protein